MWPLGSWRCAGAEGAQGAFEGRSTDLEDDGLTEFELGYFIHFDLSVKSKLI